MTFMMIEDALSDEELALPDSGSVKCSWCGEMILPAGKELTLAMCQACYERMLAEFLRGQQMKEADSHASDR